MSVQTISPPSLHDLYQAGKPVTLIDVRTPAEYREAHVSFAVNVPLDRLDPAAVRGSRTASGDEPIYVICRSGSRGRQAWEKLAAAGLGNVVNVEGGTQAWIAAGLPVVWGKKMISLERQVRIAAGSLVLMGAVLGWLVHPVFVALAALVGAGLVFSGVTDTCFMGMLLAKMPWNQVCTQPAPSHPSSQDEADAAGAVERPSSGACCT